ncbi:MAG: arginyltransferase [SAR324 cluster bacterium]|nr:arginyltransferase [SAR324 cluster bacterium]
MTTLPETTVPLYHTINGPCPYRSEGTWENLSFFMDNLSAESYEALLNQGFRRSGCSIYHPVCKNCNMCLPLRVNVHSFQPTRGQRRAWNKNTDIRIEFRPVSFDDEVFNLYRKYQLQWHNAPAPPEKTEFVSFLMESPVSTKMMCYYLNKQLIGVGWIDKLKTMLSSVYFAFDPDFSSRRPGVFSMLCEIEYARQSGFDWVYLGYWVEDSPAMKYKSDYQPAEILIDQTWHPVQSQ